MTQEEYKEEAQRLRPRLMEVARRYLDNDDAEDTVQDALMRLWQMVDSLRMPIDALARVLTRNLCIDKVRRRHTTIAIDDASRLSTDGDTESDERIERLMKVIATLPSLQQTILRLRHMEGMEMQQIAELIGSNEVAIRKALSRARQAVREKYLSELNIEY